MTTGEDSTAPAREDFAPEDWDDVVMAGHGLMSQIRDIVFHRMADDSWQPWAETGDTPALCAEVRDILTQLDEPIRKVRAALARAERPARLRRIHRTRREG